MKISTLSRVALRSVTCVALCMTHMAYDATVKRPTATGSRGIERSDIKPGSAEEQAYKQRRATESERRAQEMYISTDLVQAMINPTKWAHTFVTVYALPDWDRNLSGDQINAIIKQISDYIVSLDEAKGTTVAFIKAANKIPTSLPALLHNELRKIRKIWVDSARKELLAEFPIDFVATTANILGSFDDPFEFEGDYGTASNTTREKVFDVIVSKEAIGKNLPKETWEALLKKNAGKTKDDLMAAAINEDKENGPTLKTVVTKELLAQITKKLQDLKVKQEDIDALAAFVTKYGEKKIFYFMRNNPPDLLKLEKALKDHYADQGKNFDLPVLGSKTKLTGTTSNELKKNLVDAVFTADVLKQANPTFVDKKDGNKVKPITDNIDKYKPTLDTFFAGSTNKELHAFATPAGLAFFYWLYQALIFDLVKDAVTIDAINQVKAEFAKTLGDAQKRATVFRDKLVAAGTKLLFTQESDNLTRSELTKDGLFLPIGKQNSKDGTVILLASDFWEPDFEVIPFDEYGKFKAGKLTAILATQKETQQKFLLASGHGNSDVAADGREQMELVARKLQNLMEERNEEILLIIGVDANTKKADDVTEFQKLLTKLGLVSTQVGPTTIKRRMGTVQHNKAGLYAVDEEDYIIVKDDQLTLNDVSVGFGKPGVKPDLTVSLPNMNNQSDHYAVSARVQAKDAVPSVKKKSIKTPTVELKKIVALADGTGDRLTEEQEPEYFTLPKKQHKIKVHSGRRFKNPQMQ